MVNVRVEALLSTLTEVMSRKPAPPVQRVQEESAKRER